MHASLLCSSGVRAAASFVQAIGTLINTTRTPIEQEHKAHAVDGYEDLLALAA